MNHYYISHQVSITIFNLNDAYISTVHMSHRNINILQKEVWGYAEDLETHTVETHIYRLRKKFKKIFNDDAFIKSDKKGYFI